MKKKKIKKRRVVKGEIFINTSVALVILLFCFFFLVIPKVKLNSNYKEIININSKYNDEGITLKNIFGNKRIIKSYSKINTKKQANYKLNYRYQENIFTYHVYKDIEVKDIEKPKIMLNGDKTLYYCPSKKYKEIGYKAYDNVDKDITDKVKVKIEDDRIIYEVSDSSNNKRKIIRKIIRRDVENPVITLNGDSTIIIPINSSYKEDGVLVNDNCDGDLSSKVEIISDVDTTKAGNYKIKYEVEDNSNNKSSVTRDVLVREPLKPNTIYLTFDDGPRDGTTDVILDILKEKDVKATFFVTNNGSDSLIKRIVDEGHSIGIHTASHRYDIIYASVDNYFNDLELVKQRIYNLTGINTNLIRFPGGSSNTISKKYSEGIMSILTSEVLKRGYQYYDWNIESGDSSFATNKIKLYNSVTSKLSHDKYNVILMHDTKTYTRDSLAEIIDYAYSNGYNFSAISSNDMLVRQKVNN